MNTSSPRRSSYRSGIFSRRKKHVQPLHGAPELEESSESSLELTFIEGDAKSRIGVLDANFHKNHQSSSSSIELHNHDASATSSGSSSSGNDSTMKNIILSYKSRPKPLSDTPTPSKPYRCNSFKMDGVPAFMSREIEKKARRDAEKRRKRQQRKSKAASDQLHESMSAMSLPQTIRKQQPKVPFLDVPKDHPLYWDYSQLSASDFSEKDRLFLAKLFKNPQKAALGKRLPNRVAWILRKMQLFDWDAAIIGRCATVLFNTDTNPLNLPLPVVQYFFDRFHAITEKLVEGSPVSYSDETYKGDTLEDLFERFRRDFEEATRSYDGGNQSIPYV